jgi:hypothetical protein
MRAILIAAAGGIATAALIALISPADAAQPRAFFLNLDGGVNSCTHAATDTEVEWCAGELPNTSPANPARFDCREAEVDTEYRYCGKPYPKRGAR